MRYLLISLILFPISAWGEQMPVSYTEPSGTGFTETCVYACVQYNASACKCVPIAVTVCTQNQNGATAETINASWDIPIKDGQLPACVNYGVRSRDAERNESALVTPAGGSHVFNAP